jgi:primase-polymerase (primpol)-like protein
MASNTDPLTWGDFGAAYNHYMTHKGIDGIGYVFDHDDPYAGVDFDKCRDPQTGEIQMEVWQQIERLSSYSEVSPSETGIKVIVKGKLPEWGRKKNGFEVYDDDRYFTVTGQRIEQMPASIESRPTELLAFHKEVFGAVPEKSTPVSGAGNTTEDSELIERAMTSLHGAEFASLWRGDCAAFDGDESRADLALCSRLAFWTNGDGPRVDRLFRQSGLMRDKWDRKLGDSTYGAKTIDKALSTFREGLTSQGQQLLSAQRNGNTSTRKQEKSHASHCTTRARPSCHNLRS